MDVFERFAPFIKDFIYQSGWESLRSVQVAAADIIFNTDDNLLITSQTASGKTEAAFFPILTLFKENPPRSVGAIYIGPLKALINDQFERLDYLCERADITVHKRHGDASASHKEKLFKNPSGILQITPESLEALLLHRHSEIARLFCDLRFVVIDEVHSLLRGDRGAQTIALIERLSSLAKVNPRRIGLSATLGEPMSVAKYLSLGSGRATAVPKLEDRGARWRLSVEHFYVNGPEAADKDNPPENALPLLDRASDSAPSCADPGLGYIYEHTRGKKTIVFVNSREECELVTSTLRRYCEVKNEPSRFLIHHGNISSSIRESAEEEMKNPDTQYSVVTTATLELGIDIGRLERAFQIDAPATVSSFLQRMGRTGRKTLIPEMWFVIREDEPEMRALFPSTIPWKLLQAIALIQLYIEERFVEPPSLNRFHFSLLYHQTMTTLASSGELSPSALAKRVLSLTPFHRVTKEQYKTLLLHLIDINHIERTESGSLIVGLAGEREISSFKFYAVFSENEEFTVRCESEELGTVVMPPPVGEKLAIAGAVWEILEIDYKRHLVYVCAVKGSVPAYFGLCPGDIHTKILKRMQKVLTEDTHYPYLMKNALARLTVARGSARHSGVGRDPIICIGGNMYALFPFLGTYDFMALERIIKKRCAKTLGISQIESSKPYYMQFKMNATKEELITSLKNAVSEGITPEELLYDGEVPYFDKYDKFLPEELIRYSFAHSVLSLDGTLEFINSL